MAERDFSDLRQVTNVVPEAPSQVINVLAETGQEIIRQNQEATIQNNISKAQLELNAAGQAYQLANQKDPFGALDDYKSKRQEILDNYGKDVSPFFSRQWDNASRKLSNDDNASMQVWGYKQTAVNSDNAFGSSLLNTYKLANTNGAQFGSQGGDLSQMLNYATAKQSLIAFGNRNLGAEVTQQKLIDFEKDYLKSFVAGVATSSPTKAIGMLSNPEIKDKFTPDELGEMTKVIHKTKLENDMAKDLSMTGNNHAVTDIINDPEQTYYDKRLKIDQLQLSGALTPSMAENARRVLTSEKNVQSVTATPIMSDIITRTYDLNADAESKPADYLKGIRAIQEEIVAKQASGELNVLDVKKLNNTVRQLTSAKMASATNSVGNDFVEANEMFDQLPPEDRGAATRQLFYDTSSVENPSPELQKAAARKIIDNIKTQSRQKANKTVKAITAPQINQDDINFVTERGGTRQDITDTAKAYHMSEAEVMRWYRAKAKTKPTPSQLETGGGMTFNQEE